MALHYELPLCIMWTLYVGPLNSAALERRWCGAQLRFCAVELNSLRIVLQYVPAVLVHELCTKRFTIRTTTMT